MELKYILILLIGLGVVSLVSCVHDNAPSNRPPTLTVDSVVGVTRTSAILAGTLYIPERSRVDFCRFCYGTSPESIVSVDCPVKQGVVYARLEGLRPGTTYLYYLEAGTEAQRVMSDSRAFRTLPNEVPTLGRVTIDAQGPFSAMLRCRVLEDGGEVLTHTGFEYVLNGEEETVRVEMVDSCLATRIGGLVPHAVYTVRAFAENAVGRAYSEPLTLTTSDAFVWQQPGDLVVLVEDAEKYKVETMTLAGPLDGADLRLLRDMAGRDAEGRQTAGRLARLDMIDSRIVEGGLSYDGSHYTEADVVGNGLFKHCLSLQEVHLPSGAKRMDTDAFTGCHALRRLMIPESLCTLVPSADCPSLTEIEVSAANPELSSLQGVLYDKEGTSLLWFPLGKDDAELELSPTLVRLGDYALQGCRIQSVQLPSSVRELGIGVFHNAKSLKQVTLSEGVVRVPTALFQGCDSLRTVTLGKNTEYVGESCFDGCTALSELRVEAAVPPVCTEASFLGAGEVYTRCILRVPATSVVTYRSHAVWGKFKYVKRIEN